MKLSRKFVFYVCIFLLNFGPLQAMHQEHSLQKMAYSPALAGFIVGGVACGAGVYLFKEYQRNSVEVQHRKSLAYYDQRLNDQARTQRALWESEQWEGQQENNRERLEAVLKAQELTEENDALKKQLTEIQAEDTTEALKKASEMFITFQEECNNVFREQERRLNEVIPGQLQRIQQLEAIIPQLNAKVETHKKACREAFVYLWCQGAHNKALKKKLVKMKDQFKVANKGWLQSLQSKKALSKELEILKALQPDDVPCDISQKSGWLNSMLGSRSASKTKKKLKH